MDIYVFLDIIYVYYIFAYLLYNAYNATIFYFILTFSIFPTL